MITIKRTHLRRIPLLLRADHEDRGPYYLVDRAGYGVSWIKPAVEIRPTGEESKSAYVGNPYTRKLTWIPIFERARLAFTLVDEDNDLDPKTAKKIADETYKKLGNSASAAKAERFAHHLLSRAPKRDLPDTLPGSLTPGERDTLRLILQTGGKVIPTQGAKFAPNVVRQSTVNSLKNKGLIFEYSPARAAGRRGARSLYTRDYALTARACRLLNNE